MTSFKNQVKNLCPKDRQFLQDHDLNDHLDVICHMERLSSIFNEVSVGMLKAFSPVIQAMDQFLGDIPKTIAKEFGGSDDHKS